HLAGRLAECRLGCTVHVLDDGFQHFDLRRNADLVMIAPEDLDAKTLPSGRLREPLDAASAAAAVVWLDTGARDTAYADPAAAGRVLRPGVPAWRARRSQPRATSTAPVAAIAGTASPGSFFTALRANGWNVVAEMPFRDHYAYSPGDLARIADRARGAGARSIVTTEKDLVRLLPFRPFPLPLEPVPPP